MANPASHTVSFKREGAIFLGSKPGCIGSVVHETKAYQKSLIVLEWAFSFKAIVQS
jgi:hypothetical protein